MVDMTKLSDFERNVYTLAIKMVNDKLTLRKAEKYCNVTKSTIHTWMHECLPKIDIDMYESILKLFKENLLRAHIMSPYNLKIASFLKNINKEYLDLKVKPEDIEIVTSNLMERRIPFEYLVEEGVIRCCRL